MSWVKVDDRAWCHPKFTELSGNAVRLWMFALCWCNQHETDGCVTRGALRILGGTQKDVSELVTAGLWEATETGWQIHDFLKYQPSKAQRNEQRDRARERVERHRNNGRNQYVTHDVTALHDANERESNAAPDPVPIPSRPDPERQIDHAVAKTAEDVRASDELAGNDVERLGFPKYGQLVGPAGIEVRRLCPILGQEFLDAYRTNGKSWGYFAKVVVSIRDRASQQAPPQAPRRKSKITFIEPPSKQEPVASATETNS